MKDAMYEALGDRKAKGINIKIMIEPEGMEDHPKGMEYGQEDLMSPEHKAKMDEAYQAKMNNSDLAPKTEQTPGASGADEDYEGMNPMRKARAMMDKKYR